ncbi:MAG: class II fructose-bisphosphate aldolase [Bacillota bacterium]
MALRTLKEVLRESIGKKYAVGAFNVANHDLAEGILEASEEKGVPVIISVAEVHFRYLKLDRFIPYLKSRIEQHPEPVALHLDHGGSFDTAMQAIHYGFSSVMYDGSTLSFEENMENTAEIVRAAHAAGVSVEAELGHVAAGEGDLKHGTEVDRNLFTRPEDAREFVEKTGVDALAVAVGTVHGVYKGDPDLDFERLQQLRQEVDIPLVLHGGSGLSEDDFRQAVTHGINKINFFTGNSIAAVDRINREIEDREGFVNFPDLTLAAREQIKENVKEQIEIFGTRPL